MSGRDVEFREAVRRLQDRPTREDLADALGWSPYSVKAAMLPDSSAASRPPMDGWRPVVARLARENASRLQRLAEELDGT